MHFTVIFHGKQNADGQLGAATRTVTIGGFVRGNFGLPSSSNLETYVKRGLAATGWGINSISIAAQSYLNNFYSVTIKVNAMCNDSSSRILSGIKSFFNSFDPDNTNSPIFYDINLSVKGDTGFCSTGASSGATGLQNVPKPVKPVTPKNVVVTPVIDQGVLGVVTISASEYENQMVPQYESNFMDSLAQTFNVSKSAATIGGLFFLLLLLRRN